MGLSRALNLWRATRRGKRALKQWSAPTAAPPERPASDLERFFDARREGAGIWKCRHYFDIYERHFAKFRGMPITIVEVGVYSGGSLDMWADYFGPQATIVGVDIQPECKAYEHGQTCIRIGDQSDPAFWRSVRAEFPRIDALIDDGSHVPEHQIATLEQVFPYMAPGGVFICEDVHGQANRFAAYVAGIVSELNATRGTISNPGTPERRVVIPANPIQSEIEAIHQYPFVTVLERRYRPIQELISQKHGTMWQPFLR